MDSFDQFKERAKGKLALALEMPMLARATSDDDRPTPGYVLDNIARASCSRSTTVACPCGRVTEAARVCRHVRWPAAGLSFNSVQMSGELLDYLLKRLQKKSANVKLKALRILKYTAERGHSGFAKDLRIHMQEISVASSMWPLTRRVMRPTAAAGDGFPEAAR